MSVIVRFLGDPVGYRVDELGKEGVSPSSLGWENATIGTTDRKVWIDVSKAYLVEPAKKKADA